MQCITNKEISAGSVLSSKFGEGIRVMSVSQWQSIFMELIEKEKTEVDHSFRSGKAYYLSKS